MINKEDNRLILFYPTKKHKVRGWSVGKEIKLGSGLTSTVYQVCRKKNCEFVMKIMHSESHENIKKEICMQKICAKYNLCKTIEDWWILQEKGGVIITSVLNKTLSSAMNMDKFKERRKERDWDKFQEYLTEWFNDDENIINYITYMKKAFRLILALHQLGIYHGDSHSGNIMLDSNNNLFFIDFGFSGFFLEPNKSGIINATSYDISQDYLTFITFDFFNIGYQKTNKNLDIIKKLKKVVNRNIKIEIAKLAGEQEYINYPHEKAVKMFYSLQEAERLVIKKLINTSNEDIIKLVSTIKLKTHDRRNPRVEFCNII